MNNYPPPPPYRQGPPGYQGPSGPPPQNIRVALINQSQKRYALFAEALTKLEAGFGQLQMEAQNAAMNIARQNPQAHDQFQQSLSAVVYQAETNKAALRQQMQNELALQDELKRWLQGQPPSRPRQSQNAQAMPPQGDWDLPNQQQAPQQTKPPQGPLQVPPAPLGPVDMRDPRQAAAALLRAEPMPLGPVGQGGSPQQFTAPVQMQYADPSQGGPPNMPPPIPVVQYATPEAGQLQTQVAAPVVSAAALNANGSNGVNGAG